MSQAKEAQDFRARTKTPAPPDAAAPHGTPAQRSIAAQRGTTTQRGYAAERLAERYLAARRVTVIARNFRCRLGELDLICLDAGELVIVEVRQRATRDFGGAVASVTAAKRRRITRAAKAFLSRSDRWRSHPVRFDVLAIEGRTDARPEIIWLKAAFQGA